MFLELVIARLGFQLRVQRKGEEGDGEGTGSGEGRKQNADSLDAILLTLCVEGKGEG